MASARPQRKRSAPQGKVRSLRIGLILGGKIVEERVIRKREPISFGQSVKNTFSVPAEGLPRTWRLFAVHEGSYFLNFGQGMDGRISDGGQVWTLEQLKQQGAQQRGDGWVVRLSDNARGKVVVGEMTLLFQFVSAPPLQPRPHLPASVRGSITDRIDPLLAIIVGISLLFHGSVGIWAYQRDRRLSRTEQLYQSTFDPAKTKERTVKFDMARTPTQPGADETKKPVEKAKPTKKPTKKPRGKPGKRSGGKKAGGGGGSKMNAEQVRTEIQRRVKTVFGSGESDRGRLGGTGGKSAKEDLGKVAGDIKASGDRVAGVGTGPRGPRGDGKRRIGTTGGPKVTGPGGTTSSGPKKERVPRSRVKLGGARSDDATSLSPDQVLRKIRSVYMRGLQSCHKQVLKTDPTAGGRIRLSFTVLSSGRVSRVSVSGFNTTVDKCVRKRAGSWRFPKPKEDGDAVDASFSITLSLQPK